MSIQKSNVQAKAAAVEAPTIRTKTALELQREIDNQLVKGVFKNYETPGGVLEFPFFKYKGDPLRVYKLKDGHEYEIPLMVANHLNNDCFITVHEHALDEMGRSLSIERIGQKIHRFGFINTDFRVVQGWREPSPLVKVD